MGNDGLKRPILFVTTSVRNILEDVEAALDGVDGGDYGSFFLMFPGGYDGHLSLNGRQGTTMWWKPPVDEDRYFRIATPRRAQVLWFSGYYENQGFLWKNGKTSPKK